MYIWCICVRYDCMISEVGMLVISIFYFIYFDF